MNGLSWAGPYVGGLHPALALVPILPLMPHASRDSGLFVEAAEPPHDPLNEFERWSQLPVEGILFLFALTNAGIPRGSTGTGTWVVLGDEKLTPQLRHTALALWRLYVVRPSCSWAWPRSSSS